MYLFKSLSFRGRFLLSPLIGIVLALGLYFSSHYVIREHSVLFQRISESNLPQISEISRVTVLLANNFSNFTYLMLTPTDNSEVQEAFLQAKKLEILEGLKDIERELNRSFRSATTIFIDHIDIFKQTQLAFLRYRDVVVGSINIAENSPTTAKDSVLETRKVLLQLNDSFLVLSEFYVNSLTAETDAVRASQDDYNIVAILAIVLVLVMLFSAIYFSNRLSSDIEQVSRAFIDVSGRSAEENGQKHLPAEGYLQRLKESLGTFKQTLEKNEEHQLMLNRTVDELKDSKERYFAFLDLTATAIIAINVEQNIILFNKAAEQIFGYRCDEVIGQPLVILIPAQYRDHHCESVKEFNASAPDHVQSMKRMPVMALRKNGEQFYIEASIAKLKLAAETIMTVAITDISERKRAESALRESEGKFRSIFESAVVAFIVAEQDGTVSAWNEGAEEIFGYSSEEAVGQPLTSIVPERLRKAHLTGFQRAVDNDGLLKAGVTHELTGLRKNNLEFPMQMTLSSWKNGATLFFSAIILDITARKAAETQLFHQAHFDSLTNLPNRFLSLDRLSQLLKDAERKNELVGVLFLDLDDFKKINDTLGHETGDKVLVETGRRLQKAVRTSDTIGRLGGDEFIVLFEGLSEAADARPMVEKLLASLKDAINIDGRELILTASLGIAVFPNDGHSASELLRNADLAMYHSKEVGRNTYSYFTEAMNAEVSRRFELEEQMHGALDRGEFRLLYQPLINISKGKIVGVEALLRWTNPELGDLFPDEFIPIAEQTGLIVSIGKFVVSESLKMLARWHEQGYSEFRIAINLSPRQFRDPDLTGFIKREIELAGVSAAAVELEITEGVLISGYEYVETALAELRLLGIGIAMDDFGTGYSSLSYLRTYPFDTLKIDRSFVMDLTVDPADQQLVNATIAMAHGMGLKVVAEGVETQEQLSHLSIQGCEFAQGYFFSKPVSFEQISDLLKAQV